MIHNNQHCDMILEYKPLMCTYKTDDKANWDIGKENAKSLVQSLIHSKIRLRLSIFVNKG